MLDIHTLHIEHVVLLALYTSITIANSWLYRGIAGIHGFSFYNLFALLGAIAVALRGHIPDFLSIVIGNLFVVGAYVFLFASLNAFFHRRTRQWPIQLGLVVVAAATMLQYGWFHDDTRKRLMAYSIVLGCQQIHIAFLLLKDSRAANSMRIATTSMGCMLLALAVANTARLVGVSLQGVPHNYLNAGPFLAWIVIINSCLQCGIIVAYVWMTAAHLRLDLEVQASTDPLTRLLNRRAIEVAAEREILLSRREHRPVCAVILDLDHFKRVNDSYGHHCGDAVLFAVASALQRGMRQNDLLARIGGDEFAILLPGTDAKTAAEITAQLDASIRDTQIIFGTITTRITASFGIAELQPSTGSWEQLFLACDKALYDVKRGSVASRFEAHATPTVEGDEWIQLA